MSEQIVKRRPMIDMDEFERRLRKPLGQDQQENDLLAELARFVGGQEDPYRDVFEPLNRRSAEAARGGTEKNAGSGARTPQEPLIRGDFAAIEAGLLGAAQHENDTHYLREPEPPHFEQSAEPEPWTYADGQEYGAGPQPQFEEIRSRRPLYLMAAMIVAGVAGIGASFAFKGAASTPREIATIKAADGPAKVAAAAPAAETPNQDASVLGGAPQQQPLAAADNTEQPSDLAAQVPAPGAEASGTESAAAANPASGAASVPVPVPPQAQPQQQAEPLSIATLIEPKKVRTVSVRPDGTLLPNDTAAPAAAVPVPSARPAAPKSAGSSTPRAPAAPKTAGSGGTANAQSRTSVAIKSKPQQIADAQRQAGTAGAAAPGGFAVQFAAPATEAEARALQAQLMQKYGAELAGFHPSIRKAEVGGKSVYRVRAGGLATRDEATALCQKVQSSGGNCFVAKN